MYYPWSTYYWNILVGSPLYIYGLSLAELSISGNFKFILVYMPRVSFDVKRFFFVNPNFLSSIAKKLLFFRRLANIRSYGMTTLVFGSGLASLLMKSYYSRSIESSSSSSTSNICCARTLSLVNPKLFWIDLNDYNTSLNILNFCPFFISTLLNPAYMELSVWQYKFITLSLRVVFIETLYHPG